MFNVGDIICFTENGARYRVTQMADASGTGRCVELHTGEEKVFYFPEMRRPTRAKLLRTCFGRSYHVTVRSLLEKNKVPFSCYRERDDIMHFYVAASNLNDAESMLKEHYKQT